MHISGRKCRRYDTIGKLDDTICRFDATIGELYVTIG